MLKCETCGATFAPRKQTEEVTSLRVLCPACAEARRAAKAAKAAKDAGRAPGGPVAPVASAPAIPATSRAGAPAPLYSTPSRTARPASDRAATPTTDHPRAAPEHPRILPESPRSTPERARPAARVATQPPAVPARVAAPAAQRTNDTPARASSSGQGAPKKKHVDIDITLESQRLKKKETRGVLIGFGVSVVVLAVAGVVLWRVMGIHDAKGEIEKARQAEIDTFRQGFQAFDIKTESGARNLIAFVDEKRAFWTPLDFSAEVISREGNAKSFLDGEAKKRKLFADFEAIEQDLAFAAGLTSRQLAEHLRSLGDLRNHADIAGAEFVAKLALAREETERSYAEKLLEEAKDAAAAAELTRASLATIQASEEGIFEILNTVALAAQKNSADTVLKEKKDRYQDFYREVIKISDETVPKVFTPEVIDDLPWVDLLSVEQAGKWGGPAMKGFEHRIENGVLHMIGPDPEERAEGIISIGDKEQWHDYLLDLEFTILKGESTLFFRLPLNWQDNVEALVLSPDAYPAGETWTMRISLIGSEIVTRIEADELGTVSSPVSWTKIRKGAFGISVPKNSEVRYTKLRIKVLR